MYIYKFQWKNQNEIWFDNAVIWKKGIYYKTWTDVNISDEKRSVHWVWLNIFLMISKSRKSNFPLIKRIAVQLWLSVFERLIQLVPHRLTSSTFYDFSVCFCNDGSKSLQSFKEVSSNFFRTVARKCLSLV